MLWSFAPDQPASAGFSILGFFGGAWARLSTRLLRRNDRPVNAQTGTTYALVASDMDSIVTLTNASSIALTVPAQTVADWPIGAETTLIRGGAGQITVSAGAGQTLTLGGGNRDNFNGVGAVCFVLRTGATSWVFHGDTSAT